jgi:MoaA/NifB/PqqE/SkfB family radical SAM enzyme
MKLETIVKSRDNTFAPQESPIVSKAFEKRKLKWRVTLDLFKIILKQSWNPITIIKCINRIKQNFKEVQGEALLTKAVKVDNRYYWRMATPGFPSPALYRMHENEVNRLFPPQANTGMRTIIFSITKKCALSCEHCVEWDRMQIGEELSLDELIETVNKYQEFGTVQIMLSGGEPMLRVNDIYKLLKHAKASTDFWIITSGLGLNRFRANKLKNAGLIGVLISLDHYIPDLHDIFRGYHDSFNAATSAAIHAKNAGLVTALSLCATKSFTNERNLRAYMDLAKKLGVSFVQILEPRAAGRYVGKDVELSKSQLDLLDQIYLEYNSSAKYQEYPIINYLGFHQRRIGCFGGGNRFFYIDSDGDAHVCPFCSDKIANVRDHSADQLVNLLSKNACHDFDLNLRI